LTARLEVERMVADWLGGSGTINAYISSVPRDGGDAAPPAIAAYTASGIGNDVATPGNLAIFDPTRHEVAALMKEPPTYPALYVGCQGPILFKGEPTPAGQIQYASAPVKLVVRYITSNTNAAAARRDGDYTLRAISRSLRALSKTMPLIRNGINVILREDPLEFYPVLASIGNIGRVAGAVVTNWDIRDQQPEY